MGGEQSSKRKAHTPHRHEVDEHGAQGRSCSHTHIVDHDGGSKHGLGKSLDAQTHDTKLANLLYRGEQGHHLGSKHIHHQTHERHDGHAHERGAIGKTATHVASACSLALAHKGGCSFAYAIARHVTQALGGDGKGVGGDGYVAKGRHDHGAHDLCSVQEHRLQSHGRPYLQSRAHILSCPAPQPAVLAQAQYAVAEDGIIALHSRAAYDGERGAESCAHDAPPQHIYKNGVEQHVEHAHAHAHDARDLHVARTLEHVATQARQLEEGHGEGKDKKIGGGLGSNVASAAKPVREVRVYDQTRKGYCEANDGCCHDAVAKHVARTFKIVGTNIVGHLHGEAHGRRVGYAAHEPCGALYKTYARRCLCAEVSHHGGIDEKHHDAGYLREYRRNAQPHNEAELITKRQRLPVAYACQQCIALCHTRCKVTHYLQAKNRGNKTFTFINVRLGCLFLPNNY